MVIGQWFMGQGPSPLSGLSLRRIWGQHGPLHPCRDLQLWAHMPARAVAHQEDRLAVPSAHRLGECGEDHRERLDGDGRQPPPARPSRGGCTKVYTSHHWYRGWTMPWGRCPRRHHMRRKTGLRPRRCWSVVQSSTVSGGRCAAPFGRPQAAFLKGRLDGGVSLSRPRSRHLGTTAEALEHCPAPLGVYRASKRGGHPRCDFRPGPPSTVGWGSVERACQRGTLRGRQEPSAAWVTMASVTQPRGAMLVVSLCDGAHPVGRVAGDGCHRL